MIEHVPSWWPLAGYALGFVMGATTGPRFAFYRKCLRRRPYSSAAIAFRATEEDAAKVRSKIVNPLVWEDPPEQFIRMDEGRIQRSNGSGGPTTPKRPAQPLAADLICYQRWQQQQIERALRRALRDEPPTPN